VWDGAALTLARDPFGVRSLYTYEHGGTLFFASELKQLLALPFLDARPDETALHKYLTFSFVPGEAVPILGVRRLLPGHVARWAAGRLSTSRYFALTESIDPSLEEQGAAVRKIRGLVRQAVRSRINGEPKVGVFLSGGLDSATVAFFLRRAGAEVSAFSLDFGEKSVEREEAGAVATHLGIPLTWVPVAGDDVARVLLDVAWKLDLPFGDPVTAPLYLLGKAAREAGLACVFSGEGGDQLFGGWTSKPMLSAELYAGVVDEESPEETYLRSYHRFYGLEDALYTPEFRERVGTPGVRRAHLQPYLSGDSAESFLNRVRLADGSLKGSQNILPRAERLTNAWGLDARVPLFDRALAEASFHLPPTMKLHGATEKWVLKLAMQRALPKDVVWRRKFGMSVPVTDWALGPLRPLLDDLLGAASLKRRGLFRPEYVARLLSGRNEPGETRRRRLGERIFTLAMLEAWLRVFVDGRGRKPA
jgi:asparagine synthase (glutamine-hydrolysing)